MRVLYFTNTTSGVSTNATLRGWLGLLRPRGLEPVVVTDTQGPFFTWLRQQEIPAYCLPLPRPDKRWPFPFFRCLWQLRRIVHRHRCQVVHCNEHDIYPVGHYVGRVCRLPVVVGVRFTMPPGYCRYAFAGPRRPDRMIFVSRGNLEACRPGLTGIVPESAWRVLYNGSDLDHFRPDSVAGQRFRAEHDLGPGILLGAASALRPVKQLEHLFEAASRLSETGVRVVLAGGAVPGYEDYAARLVADGKHRLGDRFVHLGHLDDLHGFFNAIDVFVGTSQAEGCSNSVIQSLACGAPVVSYPSISVDEQVLPDGGAIVPQDNIDRLTQELLDWISDPRRRQSGRLGARRQAETLFDIRKIAGQMWEEYQRLAAQGTWRRAKPEVAVI
jgi:glycosyltransferase involved in cell wall biosynthesis